MTVQETREILGNKVGHLSDDQVAEFINSQSKLIDVLLLKFASESSSIKVKKESIL